MDILKKDFPGKEINSGIYFCDERGNNLDGRYKGWNSWLKNIP